MPSRHADFDEVLALAAAAGEGGAGSIGFLARTAVQGYDAEDRARVVKLAHASGLPVVVQGMGYRPGQREMWDNQTAFLADARRQGAAVFSMLRTQPFMRPVQLEARHVALRRRVPLARRPGACRPSSGWPG